MLRASVVYTLRTLAHLSELLLDDSLFHKISIHNHHQRKDRVGPPVNLDRFPNIQRRPYPLQYRGRPWPDNCLEMVSVYPMTVARPLPLDSATQQG